MESSEEIELTSFADLSQDTSTDNVDESELRSEESSYSEVNEEVQIRRQSWFTRGRNKLWIFLDVPHSSYAARAWGLLIIVLVIASIVVLCIQTLPEYYKDPPVTLFIIESIIVGIFTVEFIAKIVSTPSIRRYLFSIGAWIDILSIVPYYIELIIGDTDLTWLRVFRIFRVFRLFKLAKYHNSFSLFFLTIYSTLSTIVLGMFFLLTGIVLFSSFEFYAEQTYAHFDDDEEQWVYNSDTILADTPSFFQSIPHAFWWCIVSMSTVGFGDTYPISPLGKLVAAISFLAGLAIISFPIAILGNKFLELYLQKQEINRKIKQSRKERDEFLEDDEVTLHNKYPFYPAPIRKLKQWKMEIDRDIKSLEEKVATLKAQAIKIDRALDTFDWATNPSLRDIKYVDQLTEEDVQNNLPFKS